MHIYTYFNNSLQNITPHHIYLSFRETDFANGTKPGVIIKRPALLAGMLERGLEYN